MLTSLNAILLVEVSEIQTSKTDGSPYFFCRFKRGPLGKLTGRALWGRKNENGSIAWERISPDEAKTLVGHDLTGHVEIVPIDIEPQQIVNQVTGEVTTLTSRTIIRFQDETVEQAAKRYGCVLKVNQPKAHPVALPSFSLNGVSSIDKA